MNTSKLFAVAALSLAIALGFGSGCGKGNKNREAKDTAAESEIQPGGEADTSASLKTWTLPEATGSFNVGSTPPGAAILINGRAVAERTPNLFAADPGHYDVSVELEGFTSEPDSISVDVVEGQVDSALFRLKGEPLASYTLVARREKEVHPRWSPDGKTIVYEAYYEANRDIYTIPISGGEPTRITFNESADFAPSWSTDGKEIVFTSNRGGTVDLWIVKADGTEEPRRLTTGGGAEENAVFSPDGKWIAFESMSKIWRIPAKGGEPRQLTKGEERHSYPDWSPDGKEISYTVNTAEGGRQIWAVNLATGAVRKLVADKGWSYGARWSPTGKVLVFVRRGGPPDLNHDLWICSAEGGDLTQMSMSGAPDLDPSWSPDGHQIVWARNADICVMTNLPGWLLGESTPEGS